QLELDRAAACFRRTAQCAARAGEPLWSVFGRSRELLVRLLQGDVAAAAAGLGPLLEEAEERRFFGEAAFAAAQLLVVAALRGDETVTAVERALSLYRRSGHAFSAVVAEPFAVALAARAGAAEPAARRE